GDGGRGADTGQGGLDPARGRPPGLLGCRNGFGPFHGTASRSNARRDGCRTPGRSAEGRGGVSLRDRADDGRPGAVRFRVGWPAPAHSSTLRPWRSRTTTTTRTTTRSRWIRL